MDTPISLQLQPPLDILSAVSDQISTIHSIRWTISQLCQSEQENGRSDRIVQRMLEGLIVVHDLCEKRPDCVVERDALRGTLSVFQRDLQKLRQKCENALQASRRSYIHKAVSGQWFSKQRVEVLMLLEQLERDIAPTYGKYQEIAQRLTATNLSGIRANVVSGTQQIKSRLEGQIQYAASDPDRIKSFVRAKRMSLDEMGKAKESAIKSLDANTLSPVEWQYCAVKVQLLTIQRTGGSSGTEGNRVAPVSSSDAASPLDAVLETFQVLRSLDSVKADDALQSIALQLDRLQVLLRDLRLRQDAIKAVELTVELHRELAEDSTAKTPSASLAQALHRLGDLLMETDRSEDALGPYMEALTIRRQLTVIDPAEYGIQVAESLIAISQWYAADGKYLDALARTEEALQIVQVLDDAEPQETLPHLARAAHELSKRLAAVGRRGDALKWIQQAVRIRKSLAAETNGAEDNSVGYCDLASSLSAYAARMEEIGRWDDALQLIHESVEIIRKLAQQHPQTERFQEELAASLLRMSACMAVVGRNGEALYHAQRAVEMRRELADEDPSGERTQLAVALQHQGRRMEEIGEQYGAIKSMQEALHILREVVSAQPTALHYNELASCLGDLSTCLRTSGQLEAGTKYVFEAVGIRKRLAKDNPEAFLSSLATLFDQLSTCLLELGQTDNAIKYGKLAVSTLSKVESEHQQSIFRSDLALFRSNLSTCLERAGQYENSLIPMREAVDAWRILAKGSPKTFLPDLARGLEVLARRSVKTGRRLTGLRCIQEATGIYRQVAMNDPDSIHPALASALLLLAKWNSEDGRVSQAIFQTQESLTIFKSLAEQQPELYLVDMVLSANDLTRYLIDAGRNSEALETMTESVEAQRILASQRADDCQPDLAISLRNLSALLSKVGDPNGALLAAEEAVQVYRALLSRRPGVEKHEHGLEESLKKATACRNGIAAGDVFSELWKGRQLSMKVET